MRVFFRFRFVAISLFVLSLLGAGEAYSASLQKISPDLRLILQQSAQRIPSSLSKVVSGDADTATVRVVVRADCAVNLLEQAGLAVSSHVGDIFTGVIDLTKVKALAALPQVVYVETPSKLKLHLDVSVPLINGDDVRSGTAGSFTGFTGKDVIIGIIDTGIDIEHQDFKNPDGTSRILFLWDHTVDGNPPHDFTFGNECTKADIDAGTCTTKDELGHGTLVAGIAAGNGTATGNGFAANRYVGMAPEADLIVVKATDDGSFYSDRIINAIDYIQARAESLGKPVVINMSLGGQYDPHDGTDSLSRAVDEASGPGKIFVVSAGNEGNNDPVNYPNQPSIHAQGQLTATGQSDTIVITLPDETCRNTGALNDILLVVFWYEGSDSFLIRVTSPNGFIREASTGQTVEISDGNTQDGNITIDNAFGGANSNNFDNEAVIYIQDFFDTNGQGQSLPIGGDWTITITAQNDSQFGTYDLWIPGSQFCNQQVGITSTTSTANVFNTKLVGTPGASIQAVTVGAFVSRNSWVNVNGDTIIRSEDIVGDIAFFSSPGPTRDARDKPDISAPGQNIGTSLIGPPESSFAFPVSQILDDGVHVTARGTSFSAPFITGVVALMLQNDLSQQKVSANESTLQSFQVKQWLRLSALSDSFTGTVPNDLWGAGKVDVLEAMKLSPPVGPNDLSARSVSGSEIKLTWSDTDPPATSFRIYRKAGETGTFTELTTVTGTSFKDTGLVKGTPYIYRVTALYGQLESQPSNESGATPRSGSGGGGCFIRTIFSEK